MAILTFWPRFPPFEPDRVGGLAVVVWELTREMKRQGVDLQVAVPGARPAETSVEEIVVTSGTLGKSLNGNLDLSEEDRRTILKYDGILTFQSRGAKPIAGDAEAKRRTVRHHHNVMSALPLSYSRTLRPGLAERTRSYLAKREQESNEERLRGTRTVCVSQHLVDQMLSTGVEERENLSCIPNGVDTKSFRPTGAQKEFDLLFVGNFYWVKGVDVLLAAVGRLHSQGIDAKLAVAGKFDANQRKYLTNALPPAVRANLSFLGVVERARMPELMNSARLVVVPSRYETFGMVALEAIACGVPVVATRVGGLPEVVDSSVGRLVGTPDPESLAEAIQLCLRDDELAKRCSALGPRRALGYDWSVVASQLMKVFGTR